jgi:hypothetical protein
MILANHQNRFARAGHAVALTLGASLLLSACAQPVLSRVPTLVGEARDNEVAAYANHRGRRVRVSGTIVSTGLRDTAELYVRHSYAPIGVPFSAGTSVGSERHVKYPFLYISDGTDAGPDLLLCYFLPDEIDQVARVSKNQVVTVVGMFQGYAPLEQGLQVILNRCEIEQP